MCQISVGSIFYHYPLKPHSVSIRSFGLNQICSTLPKNYHDKLKWKIDYINTANLEVYNILTAALTQYPIGTFSL